LWLYYAQNRETAFSQVREKGVGEDKIDAALDAKNPKKALIRLLDQN
jgi:hypothetical protein